MKKRLLHLPTSITAGAIAIAAMVLVYLEKATLTEASSALAIIIPLLLYKPKGKDESASNI